MWAHVHKIDRIRPQPNGGAIVLVEDERTAAAMQRNPPLSVIVATARVLGARRALEVKYAGKGEVRYASGPMPPSFLYDAIVRAGAAISDHTGAKVIVPAAPAAVGGVIDLAFAELAHRVRNVGVSDMATTLTRLESQRRAAPRTRDQDPALYWTAVFELAAVAGELSRPRGGAWIETKELPAPFAIRLASGELAHPIRTAMQIVEGAADALVSTADDTAPGPEPS